jgi:hypothetical protein
MAPRSLLFAAAVAALSSGCTATYAVPPGSVAYYGPPSPVYEGVYGPRVYVTPPVPRAYFYVRPHLIRPRWYGRHFRRG